MIRRLIDRTVYTIVALAAVAAVAAGHHQHTSQPCGIGALGLCVTAASAGGAR